MNRIVSLIVLLLVMTAGLTGCHHSSQVEQLPQGIPHHIVSLGVSNDEMLLELVSSDRIAAISDMPSNLPEKAAKVSARANSSLESVLANHPDLFIGSEWMSPDFIEQIRASGISVHVVKTPRSIEDIKTEITRLGQVLCAEAKAEEMNRAIEDSRRRIHALADEGRNQGKPVPRIAYYSNNGITGGAGSLFDELCHDMQMLNVAAEAGLQDGQTLSKEQLVALAPDMIVITGSEYDKDTYHSVRVDELLTDPSLQTVPAITQKRICVVDARHLLSLNRFILNAGETIAAYWYTNRRNQNG